MADGVAITPGTGVTVATDDTGATGHVQLVKIAISTDGSPTLAPVDATHGALVNLGANNDVTITSGTVDLGATDNAVLDAIAASLATLDNVVSGSEAQVDVVGALPAGSAVIGKVDHPTTGIANGRKVTVSAGTAVALASSTTAKWVMVQAETNNTGLVVVGGSGVIAALATRQGIALYAGESYGPVAIDNLADVYIDATVSGDGVTFTYGTGS